MEMVDPSPLTAAMDTAADAVSVVVVDGDDASGLADMLRQFIEQALAESPRKVKQARALSGRAVFRSAEDQGVCVCITFARDQIELRDVEPERTAAPSVTADFLTIAHLAAGQQSPFRLLVQRKLKVRFRLSQIPFLLRVLRFMQIESEARRAVRIRRGLMIAAVVAFAGGACWYIATIR